MSVLPAKRCIISMVQAAESGDTRDSFLCVAAVNSDVLELRYAHTSDNVAPLNASSISDCRPIYSPPSGEDAAAVIKSMFALVSRAAINAVH